MHAEVFFIYHNGEQRGPYTAAQINHLHRCTFIDDDTLYWREGLEQWQPVGQIVLRRRRRNRLLFWFILLGVIVVLAPLLMLFGPVTLEAWRELTSGDFTTESAWWRARGLVREQLPKGAQIHFDPFSPSQVTLRDHESATVTLSGALTNPSGSSERGAWRVLLRYDENHGTWGASPKSDAQSPPK